MSDDNVGHLVSLKEAIAGLVGVTISLIATEKVSRKVFVLSLLGGAACAVYIGPFVSDYLNLSQAGKLAAQLITGLTGGPLMMGIIKLAQGFAKDPLGVISKTFTLIRGGQVNKD